MTRSELIRKLALRYPSIYLKDIELILDTILEEIVSSLCAERRIELRGFGAFSIRKRKPRLARNPRTNSQVSLEERRVIYFRAGKELREQLNA